MPKPQIRRATSEDVVELTTLAQSTYQDAYGLSMPPADLNELLKTTLSPEHIETFIQNDVVLLAIIKAEIVGYTQFGRISLSVETAPTESRSLNRLYVQRKYQNRGIGGALLNAALQHPELANANYIYLDVWEKNVAAQRFYRRHGFKIVDQYRFILPSGQPADLDYIMMRPNRHKEQL